jgi:hypothetical protein
VFVLVDGFESLHVLGLRICHDQFSAFHNQLNIYFARATDRVTGTADLFRVPATIPMKNPTVVPNTATPRGVTPGYVRHEAWTGFQQPDTAPGRTTSFRVYGWLTNATT